MAEGGGRKRATLDLTDRFKALFEGNTRSSGRFDPQKQRMHTEYAGLTREDFMAHLKGVHGVGAVPIQDDDTCLWAAIDIDNHDSDEDIPIAQVDEKIRQNNLPLVPCRSKSGGCHAYLFLEKPLPASQIRAAMTRWAAVLGYPGHEVFPKQAKLANDKEGKKQLGNWINLPYMKAAETERYAVRDGKFLSLEEFVVLAEKSRCTESQLRSFTSADHPDAPPCVQKMYANGVAQGHRNEGLYNIVVYLRKSNPEGYQNAGLEANNAVFTRPLPRAEALRTIASAGRPDYGYRCNEEPCRTLCDRPTCLTRRFGITPEDAQRLASVDAIPPFTELIKYVSEPVRWELKIDGVKVTNLPTEALLDFRAMRQIIAERLTKVVPLIKNNEWERILAPLMKEARIVEVPDDASVNGVVRDRLREFASKTDLANKGQNLDDRKALMRGMPVVAEVNIDGVKDRCVVFRGQDFINYLKRTRSEELKGINLWMAMKGMGVTSIRIRAGAGESPPINVWVIPVKEVLDHRAPAEKPEFRSEI